MNSMKLLALAPCAKAFHVLSVLKRPCTCGMAVMPSGKKFQSPARPYSFFAYINLTREEDGESKLLSFAQRTRIDLDLMFAK